MDTRNDVLKYNNTDNQNFKVSARGVAWSCLHNRRMALSGHSYGLVFAKNNRRGNWQQNDQRACYRNSQEGYSTPILKARPYSLFRLRKSVLFERLSVHTEEMRHFDQYELQMQLL